MPDLSALIPELFALSDLQPRRAEALDAFAELRHQLNRGHVRAASPSPQGWSTHAWVKQGILLGFRLGQRGALPSPPPFQFFDKDTLPLRDWRAEDEVRIVPGGTTVRDGAYLAPGVICMPPAFVNIGAYVDRDSLIDSHALVGSCAQLGQRVHLSAAAQIGGVLEPVNAAPVIIEDDVTIGGNCGVYEGTHVGAGAVLAAGTVVTRSTPIYDLVHGTVIRAQPGSGLRIPPSSVVVPGSRAVTRGAMQGLSLYTPVIVKYRDDRTDISTALESWLR